MQFALLIIAWVASGLFIIQAFSRRENNQFSIWIFSGYILLQAISTLLFVLVDRGLILEYWYLYRVAAPLSFLIPPTSYLYVRSILEDDTRFRRSDIKHLLLFGFVFVHYLPFFVKSKEEKIAHITAVVENYSVNLLGKEGLFPENVISFLRALQLLVYVWLHWKLLRHTAFFQKAEYTEFEKNLRFWIKGFTTAVTAYYIPISLSILSLLVANVIFSLEDVLGLIEKIYWWNYWVVLCGYLFFTIYLLIYPEVNLGIMTAKNGKLEADLQNDDVDQADLQLLEGVLIEKKPWLDPSLNLYQFSKLVDLTPRRTSYLLNNYHNENFNKVINRYRVDCAIDKIKSGYLDQFTTDSLWKECGFSNPSTFFVSFKRITNSTPSEFAKSVETVNTEQMTGSQG